MITIYSLTYNEEIRIQFMIDHYRSRFPNCNIIFYDNSSTDNTTDIATKNSCEIRKLESNNTLDDGLHMKIKNTCWKNSGTNWVLVCDLDELLDINESALIEEEKLGNSIIRTEGWNMINLEDNYDLYSIKYGVRDPRYDKCMLFNKSFISEINYGAGCHDNRPIGNIKYSQNIYKMYHYKYINPDFVINSYKVTATRLSKANIQNNWGNQALRPESETREYIQNLRKSAIKIL